MAVLCHGDRFVIERRLYRSKLGVVSPQVLSLSPALLRLGGEFVGCLSGNLPLVGDPFGSLTLARLFPPPVIVRLAQIPLMAPHRDSRDMLDSSRHDDILITRPHFRGGQTYRLLT